MTEFRELEVFDCPLSGVNLIEASAGTGKTWNICWLYLRLLLEQGLQVREILVVTFTTAATAELRDRIRGRIVDTLGGLERREAGMPLDDDDPVQGLLARLIVRGRTPAELRDRLALALACFDEAAIYTIHGFCQRALADAPFSAAQPFELDAVQDDQERLQQAVYDFWRRRVAHAPPGSLSPLLARYLRDVGDTPEKLAALLRPVVAKPLARLHWPPDLDAVAAPDEAPVQQAFAAAQRHWGSDGAAPSACLLAALAEGRLKANSYKPDSVAAGRLAWTGWFASGVPAGGQHRADGKRLGLFAAERLAAGKGTKKGCQPPQHPFFAAAETLLAACDTLDQALRYARLRWLRELVETVPAALRQGKRQQRVVSFDDMLRNLHEALSSDGGDTLAMALRRRFPAALIDEFQDTDPLQLGIFDRLYGQDAGPLFMVGDPKQAIYRFRNADLHTYLAAQQRAGQRYSLPRNQRSVAGLIAGGNALFGVHERAFLQEGIAYRPVSLGDKQRQPGFPALVDHGAAARAPLQVWLLPRAPDGQRRLRAEAFPLAAATVAAEIARLLGEARAGRVTLGQRPLRARDIAVLVRSHAQGRRMRDALAVRGIASVELSQASVFTTVEAEELACILLAVAEKRDASIRAALATGLLGHDAVTLDGYVRDEAAFFRHVQAFAGYREQWEQRGFAVMFRHLLREQGIEARLLREPHGERRLTNLLHLGELLAQAAREHAGIDAQLRWLQAQRLDVTVGDSAQLRLESDSERVQIVTIHKSKGLEYAVVFCPFLWDGYRNSRSDAPDLRQYHRAGTTVLDFDPAARDDLSLKAAIRDEDAAETLRLIYVALTRAVHRVYLIAGCYERCYQGSRNAGESTRSLLNWLVAGGGMTTDDWFDNRKVRAPDAIEDAWRALAERAPGGLAVAELPALETATAAAPETSPPCRARPFRRVLVEGWNRGSFTGMTRQRAEGESAADHDADAPPMPGERSVAPADLAADDILRFPAGPGAGSCIHRLFELADLARPAAAEQAIRQALGEYPQQPVDGLGQPLAPEPMLGRLLRDVLATPLPAGAGSQLWLSRLKPGDVLREMAFTLAADTLTPERLNAFLRQQGYALAPLSFRTLRGYLTGAIDLVFRSGGRYYLLDWKSNHLGYAPADYDPVRLHQAMREHAYPLQYLLYTLALHRQLARRLPGYDYDRHFGGVLYLFVRAVRPDWGDAGIFFDRPSAGTVAALDALIGRAGAASP